MRQERETKSEIEVLLTPEIIKAQKEYVIRNFYDLIKALLDNPTWLEIIRKLILTEELLKLPHKFDELSQKLDKFREEFEKFKEEEFKPLKEKVDKIEEDVSVLKEDVSVLKQDVAVLKQDVAVLKGDVRYLKGELGKVKGWAYEWKIKENFYAYFGRVLRKARRISLEELSRIAEEAEEKGLISEDQYVTLLEVDLVLEGQLKLDKKPVILAVEISHSVYESDIKRALDRANILALLLKREVIPTVIGTEVKEELISQAEDSGVLLIKAEI